jgi:hypothetical protein
MIGVVASILGVMTYVLTCIVIVALTLVLTGFLIAAYKWMVNRL